MIYSANLYALGIGLPLVALAAYWYWFFYKHPVYLFSSLVPLASALPRHSWRKLLLFLMRAITLATLCLALARFQMPDEHSKIPVQGVDIMLVLDISDSMNIFDDLNDKRTRLDVARAEALKFIDKRQSDPIGLVIFSGVAVSRCPVTLDKNILKEILSETNTGTIEVPGTVLSRSILTAANRLKRSTAKSKIMIVLTDGAPRGNDTNPQLSVDLAKKLGIKIYTVGIGSEKGGWLEHPLYGMIGVKSEFNKPLLEKFASETGGKFFHAQNPADMEAIYSTIDALERTEHDTPLFARYFEFFIPLLLAAFLLLIAEILVTTFFWVRL